MKLYERNIPLDPEEGEPTLKDFSKLLAQDGWVSIRDTYVIDMQALMDQWDADTKNQYMSRSNQVRKRVMNFFGGDEDNLFKVDAHYLVALSNGKPLAGKDSFFHDDLKSVVKLLRSKGMAVESFTNNAALAATEALLAGGQTREVIKRFSE